MALVCHEESNLYTSKHSEDGTENVLVVRVCVHLRSSIPGGHRVDHELQTDAVNSEPLWLVHI